MKLFRYKGKDFKVKVKKDIYREILIDLYSSNKKSFFSKIFKTENKFKKCYTFDTGTKGKLTDELLKPLIMRAIERYYFEDSDETQDYDDTFNLTPGYEEQLFILKEENLTLLKKNENLDNQISEYKKRLDNIQSNEEFVKDMSN